MLEPEKTEKEELEAKIRTLELKLQEKDDTIAELEERIDENTVRFHSSTPITNETRRRIIVDPTGVGGNNHQSTGFQRIPETFVGHYGREPARPVESSRTLKIIKDVPIFNGNPVDYPVWEYTFKVSILDEPLPDGVKFLAFQKATTHLERMREYGHMEANLDNLTAGLDHLARHYGRSRRRVEACITEICKCKPYSHEDSLEVLDHLLSKISLAIHVSKSAQKYVHYRDRIRTNAINKLSAKIVGKLVKIDPDFSVEDIVEYLRTVQDNKTIVEETIAINKELATAERTEVSKRVQVRTSITSTQEESTEPAPATNNSSEDSLKCVFDGQPHRYRHCPLSAQERVKIADERRLCHLCLKDRKHPACRKRHNRCYKCQGSHHPCLCDLPQPERNTIPKTLCNIVGDGQGTYKTLVATAKSHPVRVLFDEASGENFITERLVKLLELETHQGPNIIVDGFGGARKAVEYARLELYGTNNKPFQVELYVVPTEAFGCTD